MPLNISKSKCMRFGSRFKFVCTPIVCDGAVFEWVSSMKYLGVNINSGLRFKFNPDPSRKKFLSAFNTIYGRIGNKNSIDTVTSLLTSICAPILMYGTELIRDDAYALDKLCKSYDRTFMKIF